MNDMEKILNLVKPENLAVYILAGRQLCGHEESHSAKDLEDAAYQELEAELEGMEREKKLSVLDAALNYSSTLESTAFAYGMKAGALLLQSLFSREELLF